MSEMLKLANIIKRIKEVSILDNINLEVKAGEIVALLGESGSGKSTVLQVIGLLTSINSGSIIINDKDCTNLPLLEKDRVREKIGFIHQFHHLLPEFTVIENLLIPQIASEVEREVAFSKASKMLEKFGLESLSDRKPHELSGGQNQRIAILRAFINNPFLVLADEPTGHLDFKNAEEIFDFILKNSRINNITNIIVTHNHDLAMKTDRIIRMEDLQN